MTQLLIEAVIWGFVALLTPCVFPMVPMTVSFFLKGSDNKKQGRFKAMMYGLFIIMLYTLPIAAIILITRIAGGGAVTADIFNWLANHWIPNSIFFVVFMVFAASFFGFFELELPSSLTSRSDRNADRAGLAGVFFMALTLVLVSFSCTGPIVGTVIIKSTAGEFWAPILTMLCFSTTFAIPFTLLAFFPSLLKKMPKIGSWLGSVKVVLGCVEIALGLKFLSNIDLSYKLGLLSWHTALIIWVICFGAILLFELGVIGFPNAPRNRKWSAGRIVACIVAALFEIYLVSGFFGNPLNAISGYLPPREIKQSGEFEEDLARAREQHKLLFLDFTGYNCVNCREMEALVLNEPRVKAMLDEHFTISELYMDDKTELPQDKWITDENGKTYKTVGKVNSYISNSRFGNMAMPFYVIMDPETNQVLGTRSYNTDADAFLEFLSSVVPEQTIK